MPGRRYSRKITVVRSPRATTCGSRPLTLPGGSRRSLQVTDKGRKVNLVLPLSEGEATLRLQTVSPAAPHPPADVRDLRLRVQDPRVEYVPLQPARLTVTSRPATP